MSDTFDVSLTNNVSGPAKEAAAALRKMQADAASASAAVGSLEGALSSIKPPKGGAGSSIAPAEGLADLPGKRKKKAKSEEAAPAVSGEPAASVTPPKKALDPIFKSLATPESGNRLATGIIGAINKIGSMGNKIQNEFGDEIGKFALQAVGEKGKETVKNLLFNSVGGLVKGAGSLMSLPFTMTASAVSMMATAMLAGVGAAVAFTGAVAGAAVSMAKMSAEARMARETTAGMTIGLDTKAIMSGARDASDVIGTSANEIAASMAKLRRKGLDTNTAQDLVQGMADLDIMGGSGAGEAFAQAAIGLGNKNTAGLDTIREALGKGKGGGGEQFDKILAGQLGLAGSGKELTAQIEAAVGAGKLSKDAAVSAALAALSKTTKKNVGGVAEEFANDTLVGNVKSLKTAWDSLMSDVNAGGGGIPLLKDLRDGLKKGSESGDRIREVFKSITSVFDGAASKIDIKGLLGDVSKVFDPATASGQRFQGILAKVGEIFDKVMGSGKKGGLTLVDGIEVGLVVLEKAADIGLKVATVFETVSPKIREFFKAAGGGDVGAGGGSVIIGSLLGMIPGLGTLVGQVGLVTSVFSTLGGAIKERLSDAGSWLAGVGSQIVSGLWSGLTSAWSAMLGQFSALVALLPASVKDVLGIHSPSRVFRDLGIHTMAGFEIGIDKGAGGVDAAMQSAVSPDGVAPMSFAPQGAASASASASTSVGDIVININSSSADPQAVAQQAIAELARLFESMGLELGQVQS